MEIECRSDETFKNMVAEIRWADSTTVHYHSIVEYLLKYWDIGIASGFTDIMDYESEAIVFRSRHRNLPESA